jgi:hypothetical protein
MAYQVKYALPHYFARFVLLKRSTTLEPLYHFDPTLADGEALQERLREQ